MGGLASKWDATHTRESLERLNNKEGMDLVWIVGDASYSDDSFGHVTELLHFDYDNIYGILKCTWE